MRTWWCCTLLQICRCWGSPKISAALTYGIFSFCECLYAFVKGGNCCVYCGIGCFQISWRWRVCGNDTEGSWCCCIDFSTIWDRKVFISLALPQDSSLRSFITSLRDAIVDTNADQTSCVSEDCYAWLVGCASGGVAPLVLLSHTALLSTIVSSRHSLSEKSSGWCSESSWLPCDLVLIFFSLVSMFTEKQCKQLQICYWNQI